MQARSATGPVAALAALFGLRRSPWRPSAAASEFWLHLDGSWCLAKVLAETRTTLTLEVPDAIIDAIRQSELAKGAVVLGQPAEARVEKGDLNLMGWCPVTIDICVSRPDTGDGDGIAWIRHAAEVLTNSGRLLFDEQFRRQRQQRGTASGRRAQSVPRTRSEIMTWFREEARKLHPDTGGSGDVDALRNLIQMRNSMLVRAAFRR